MLGTISHLWTLVGQAAVEKAAVENAVEKAEKVANATPFYAQGWFISLAVIIGLVAIWWLTQQIAKSIKMPDYGGRLGIIGLSAAIAGVIITSGFVKDGGPKMGVDLKGGVNIIGQLNLDEINDPEAAFGSEKVTAEAIIPNLLRRVDPSGTKEILIRPLGRDKIEVVIPDVSLIEAREIWRRLSKTGHLQFRIAADRRFHPAVFTIAEEAAGRGETGRTIYTGEGDDKKAVAKWYNLARMDRVEGMEADALLPIKYIPSGPNYLLRDKRSGRIININGFENNGKVKSEAAKKTLRALRGTRDFTDDMIRGLELAEELVNNGFDTPQMLMMEPKTDRSDVQGKHLTAIRSGRDETGRPNVSFELNNDGARRMSYLTTVHKKKSEGQEYLLGIVLDNNVYSAPTIESPIHGSGQISGSFTQKEIDDLIINLRSGKIDVALNKNPISQNYIESSLGQELQQKGFWAIGASLVIVLIFMIIYYRFAGIVASLALMLNLVLILALIMAIRQPLTLTGLAGLVLTVGMSVDANVLIFERIREELAKGAALRMAIRNGFDKATVTIVDANVTTLITALVLYVIGSEQIKGFAVTLVLGILMSMFTAIYCSRTVFDIFERRRWISKLNMFQIIGKRSINFLGKRAFTFAMSAILIVAGIVGIYSLGAKILDHDLRGGSTAQVIFNEDMNRTDILDTLEKLPLEHNGEKLEFAVSRIKSDDFKNVFKIDSNLPPYDNPKLERWDQLDDILTNTFKDKLRHHNVEVGPITLTSNDGTAYLVPKQPTKVAKVRTFKIGGNVAEAEPVESNDSEMVPVSFWNYTAPSILHNLAFGPITILQQSGESEIQEPAVTGEPIVQGPVVTETPAVTETQEPAITETQEPALEGTGTEPAVTTPTQETSPMSEGSQQTESTNPELPWDSGMVDDELPNDALPGIGLGAGQLDDEPRNDGPKNASFTLSFENKISGKGIKTLLAQFAERMEREIDESQITVIPKKLDADTSAELTLSKDWTVEIPVSNEAEAQKLTEGWSSEFNGKAYFPVAGGVGGQIASQTQWQAIMAIVASLLGIIAYVWIRFQNVAFGLAAVVALIHDVLIVLGAIALSHYVAGALGFILIEDFKISLPVIAALLTIIGYSLNDTIVVFDRIREVRGKRTEMTEEIINSSISQTLSRTILTSLTTFIVVAILYWFGGDAIHGFAFALVIGVIVGTYSSIFIASPTLLWLMNRGFSPEYDEHGNPIRKIA